MGQVQSNAAPTDAYLLSEAAKEGNVDVLSLFLKKNATLVYASDQAHSSAWHAAAQQGHAEVLELLIATAKEAAVSNNHDPLVRTINQQDAQGRTPLMLACAEGHDEAVRVLISYGADVWPTDRIGRTCLHLAALKGSFVCVRLVLSRAAQTMVCDDALDQNSISR